MNPPKSVTRGGAGDGAVKKIDNAIQNQTNQGNNVGFGHDRKTARNSKYEANACHARSGNAAPRQPGAGPVNRHLEARTQ